jgi:hypothetical protein
MQKTERGNSSATPASPGRARQVELADLDMRIARDGTWFYRGSPITRMSLVKLFASVLRREPDGRYWLVTPADLDEMVTAGPDPKLRVETAADGTPAPYVLVRPGLEAKLTRPVFYELAELGQEELIAGESQFGVWSGGMFFRLGDPGEE